ncbi:MAG TPA: hypothetical protein VKF35_05065 [Hyphomicrobiaceae bacterium]|nr:hypothetical protein [Hyphomicrobiaceae bacterium]
MLPRAREVLISDWRWLVGEMVLGVLVVLIGLGVSGLVDVAQILKDYQVLIGTLFGIGATGLAGFFMITSTMRANAESVLLQREREIEQERVGARAMILAELMVMQDNLSIMHQVCMEGRKRNNFTVPKFMGASEMSRGYRGQLAKIGLLSNDQMLSVVWAYATQEGMYSNWKWMEQLQSTYDTTKNNQPHEVFVTSLQSLLRRVEAAIVALGGEILPRNRNSLSAPEASPLPLAEERPQPLAERRAVALAQ